MSIPQAKPAPIDPAALAAELIRCASVTPKDAGAIGVLATGTLDSATVASLLRNLPPGNWELVTHPGYNDADLNHVRTRLRATREIELEALRTLEQFPAVERISFADLQPDEHREQ